MKIVIALCVAAVCVSACAGRQPVACRGLEPLQIADLVRLACRAAERDGPRVRACPPHLDMLLADGRITIGLGIGTHDLGCVRLPRRSRRWKTTQHCRIFGRDIVVDARLILTNADFSAALEECEVIFVTSHSRFGAGPAFLLDGKDNPFLMQTTPGYEVRMPDSEVHGYQGRVLRTYRDDARQRSYTVFAPDSRDLDRSLPLRAYQVLVLSTCSSRRHFLDDIRTFRGEYPTTAFFTNGPALMDRDMRIFKRLLYELFRGASGPEITEALNEEYRNVAWSHIRRGSPPWRILDNLYTLGIDTVGK